MTDRAAKAARRALEDQQLALRRAHGQAVMAELTARRSLEDARAEHARTVARVVKIENDLRKERA